MSGAVSFTAMPWEKESYIMTHTQYCKQDIIKKSKRCRKQLLMIREAALVVVVKVAVVPPSTR